MKNTWKKMILGAAALLTVSALGACSKKESAADSGKVKIGILQLLDQTALNDAKKGFEEGLEEAGFGKDKVEIDFLNAQGDQSNLKTMSERLKRDKNDLNVAIATPAAQALQKVDSDTPLLFTAITDPVSAGLMKDSNKPDKNATGVTDMVDVAGQIEFLHRIFPKAKKIGLLFNAAEANSVFQVEIAKKKIEELGLTAVEKTAASTNDVEQAATALADQVDAIYIPTDNVAAAAMPTIGKVSEKMEVPVVNADATMIQFAGVATEGINYEDLGRQTAAMAVKILKGEKVANLPVEQPEKVTLVSDEGRMKLFGITQDMLEEK